MADEDRIYDALLDLKQDMGEVKGGLKSNHEFIQAVSGKADRIKADLDTHKAQDGAHGVGIARKTLAAAGGVVIGTVALIELAFKVWWRR